LISRKVATSLVSPAGAAPAAKTDVGAQANFLGRERVSKNDIAMMKKKR
jgi:hypothetical protein